MKEDWGVRGGSEGKRKEEREGGRISYLFNARVTVDTQEWETQRFPARFDPKKSTQAASVKPLPVNGSAGQLGWSAEPMRTVSYPAASLTPEAGKQKLKTPGMSNNSQIRN